MTVDVATLVFDFKSDSAVQAEKAMDQLITKGERLEAVARKVRKATDYVNDGHRGAAGAVERATQASMALANAEGAVEKATLGAGRASAEARAQRQLEAAAMRELVVATKALEREQAAQQARAVALKASYDPLGAAIDRVNAELVEANRLHKAGALSEQEHARATAALASRLAALNNFHAAGAKNAKLQAYELTNLGSQLADIGVSLASGQALWLVAIQQGSQIAGIYGSAAARGATLKSVVADVAASFGPLVGAPPLAVGVIGSLAVVVGVLAKAFLDGEKEANAFANAIKATGNFAGLTGVQFEAMNDDIAKSTKAGFGNVREALMELVSSGKFSGETIRVLGEDVVRLGQLTGKTGAQVASEFTKMGSDVAAFATTFNEQYHLLTAAQIEHIRLLQEQGRVTEAQLQLSIDIHKRLGEEGPAQLGYLERAWRGVANAIGGAWANLKGFGNESVGRSKRLEFLNAEINDLEDGRGSISRYGVIQTKGQIEAKLEAYRQERLALNFVTQQEEARAKQQAASAQAEQAAIRAQEEHARTYRTLGDNAAAARAEIEKYRAGQAAIRKANPASRELDSAARAAEIEAAITKKYMPAATQAGNAAARLAERLDRQSRSTQATIDATLDLADAYAVGDVEALKAQARADAVGRAIKAKGDIDTFVTEQMALNAAKLTAQGAKQVRDLQAEAAAREVVKARIVAGLATQDEFDRAVGQELAIRPLLAAALAAEGKERERLLRIVNDLGEAYTKANRAAGIDELEAALKQRNDALTAAPDFTALDDAVDKTTRLADSMSYLAERTENAADLMSGAFGKVGDAIGGVSVAQARAQASIAAINADLAKFANDNKTDPQRVAEERVRAAERVRNVEVRANIDALESFKGLFSKKSAAYRVLTGLEMAYQAVQIAGSIKAMAVDAVHTAKSIANALARGAADAAAGAAKIFAQLGPFGFPVVAAMVGVLAALGLKLAGGGGGGAKVPTAEERQAAQGAGTVLGDTAAKSESISRSLELVAANTNRDLEYSNAMLSSLRSIDENIGSLTNALARQLGVGGALDTSGLGLGVTASEPGLAQKILNPISALLPGLFGKTVTKTLQDVGLRFGAQSLDSILSGGLQGESYADVLTKTKKKFFGVTVSNKSNTSTTTAALDADLTAELTRVVDSLRTGVLAAASALGIEGADATLKALQVSLGTISLKDLKPDELNAALEAVFGKLGDQMAAAVLPSITTLQKAGEGAFETLTRVARQYQVIDTALSSVGMSFGAVGVASLAARERLVDLFGGLDQFAESVSTFSEKFLTDAQRLAPVQAAVAKEMERLGLASVTTKDAFRDVVLGLDVSTEAGAKLYAAMMAVAPAFALVADAATELANKRRALEIQIMDALGDTAGATAARRADALAELDPSLRGLQQILWNLADAAEAAAKAQDALKAANDNVSKAQDAARDAFERDAQAIRTHIDEMEAAASALADFRRELDFGSIAGRDPLSQYAATKREFDRLNALSANDPERLANLQNVSQAFLEASRAASPTQLAFDRDLNAVRRAVEASQLSAQREADIGRQQLDALNAQMGALGLINTSVLTVAQAVNNLREALVMQAVAKQAANGGAAANDNFNASAYLAANKDIAKYAAANGLDPAAFARQHYFGTGQYEIAAGLRTPGFAAGGWHSGGLRIVGEEGAEIEATGPARYYSAQDTRRMLSGGDGELAEEVRALRQEVAALRAAAESTAASNGEMNARDKKREILGTYVRGQTPDDPVETTVAA